MLAAAARIIQANKHLRFCVGNHPLRIELGIVSHASQDLVLLSCHGKRRWCLKVSVGVPGKWRKWKDRSIATSEISKVRACIIFNIAINLAVSRTCLTLLHNHTIGQCNGYSTCLVRDMSVDFSYLLILNRNWIVLSK